MLSPEFCPPNSQLHRGVAVSAHFLREPSSFAEVQRQRGGWNQACPDNSTRSATRDTASRHVVAERGYIRVPMDSR